MDDGPGLPKFETPPPEWLTPYYTRANGHLTCGILSLADLGDQVQEVDPVNVWGLNFSIRKKTLFEVGGFHPDGLPKELLHFRGDGETGLAQKLKAKGYKALYHPGAKVYHHIPSSRLTAEFFEYWHFRVGVGESYTNIRKRGAVTGIPELVFDPKQLHIAKRAFFDERDVRIGKAYVEGYNFHLKAVRQSPELLAWVLKDNYFDYALPEMVLVSLARLYYDLGRYEEALTHLQQAIELNHAAAEGWLGIALIAKQFNDQETCLAAYKRAHSLGRVKGRYFNDFSLS